MNTPAKTATIILVISIAIAAAIAGFWVAKISKEASSEGGAPRLVQVGPLLAMPEPKPLSDFSLYDHTGSAFTPMALEGRWTLVFFGFASCPHICPNTLYKLTSVVEQLEGGLPAELIPQILFVSVDPERDTAEVLDRYRERFSGQVLTVSGPDDQLRTLALDLGAHYVIPEHEPGEWYNVDHSASVHLLNPDGEWAGVFSAPHDAGAIASSLETYLGDS